MKTRRFFSLFFCVLIALSLSEAALAAKDDTGDLDVEAKAVVLMEKTTGELLYEENAHQPLEPASVTKVMTLLLIMEALDSGVISKDTMVPVSAAAASMGGSQVFLKEGEELSVNDMLKAIAVASGNDASVAMAEYLAGSESSFVEKMNAKAAQLGMEDTVFQNCTGLPMDGHHTSAYDIALMSRELILNHGFPPGRDLSAGQHQQVDPLLQRLYGPQDRVHGLRPLLPVCHGGEGGHGAHRRGPGVPHQRRPLRGR